MMSLQKCADRSSSRAALTETLNETETSNRTDTDEFNSFQFWRDPLPTLGPDLLELLVSRTVSELTTCTETEVQVCSCDL